MDFLWVMNIVGLCANTIAAGLMYYFPPRGITLYADDGSPIALWQASPSEEGRRKAKVHKSLSRSAPVLLAAGFGLQLVSALFQAWPKSGG